MRLCLYFLYELQREFLLLAILILKRIDLTPCLLVGHLPCLLPRLMAPWQLQYLPDLLPMAWCLLHRCLPCILRLPSWAISTPYASGWSTFLAKPATTASGPAITSPGYATPTTASSAIRVASETTSRHDATANPRIDDAVSTTTRGTRSSTTNVASTAPSTAIGLTAACMF